MSAPHEAPAAQGAGGPHGDEAATALARLASLVVEDAARRARRETHRALAEARQLVTDAEDHVEALRRAAKALGRTRGSAAEAALQREAEREVEGVLASARQAFAERFHRRLALALEERLRDDQQQRTAFALYARRAAASITGPVEIRTLAARREAVYDAFLAAGVEDFQVVGDPRIHAGFVVRDLDGRTVFDARPAAIVEAHADAIAGWLDEALEPFELSPPDGGA
ncbi:MAG: hypothetical protein AB7T63_13775 [Planctomycetota bacterium]